MSQEQIHNLYAEAITFQDNRGRTSLETIKKQSPALYKQLMKSSGNRVKGIYNRIAVYKKRLLKTPKPTGKPVKHYRSGIAITEPVPFPHTAPASPSVLPVPVWYFRYCPNCQNATQGAQCCDRCGFPMQACRQILNLKETP